MKISEMRHMTDIEFAVMLLQRRLDRMYNPNTPYARKLASVIRTLQTIQREGGAER